jgi:hypothetical protein
MTAWAERRVDVEPEPNAEHVPRDFIDRMFAVVEALLAMSGQHESDVPDVAAHLALFAEQVAGVAIEAICTWPTRGVPSCSTA